VVSRGAIALPARILGTATVLPGPPRPTAELARDVAPPDGEAWQARTGIRARHRAGPGALMAPLGTEAVRRALAAAGLVPEALRRVVFASSMGGDRIFPATGNRIVAALGIDRRCDTFDLNASCLGFLHGLDIAARSVATGLAPVAIVTVELGSRVVSPAEPRLYMRFGDAAVATIVGAAGAWEGIRASYLVNHSPARDEIDAVHPMLTSVPEMFRVRPTGEPPHAQLRAAVTRALERAAVRLDAIDAFLLQQPDGRRLDRIVADLGLDPARVVRVVDDLGAIGSACVPAALDRLLRTRPPRPGALLLLAGTGGGGGAGAIVYQVGPRKEAS
jgi:3-oxoacyl-[acyl-carrier-protein] synthase III